jgi:hypothetical protein
LHKKQKFEMKTSEKEDPGPCKKGWGAAPFFEKVPGPPKASI